MIKRMKNCSSIVLAAVFWLFAGADFMQARSSQKTGPAPISLSEGWQYRWGDSPLDENGVPSWIYREVDSQAWKSCDSPYQLPGGGGKRYIVAADSAAGRRLDRTGAFSSRLR